MKLAEGYKLFPNKMTRVKGNSESDHKRTLLQLSFDKENFTIKELIVETARHVYTEDYKKLVQDFYLKL